MLHSASTAFGARCSSFASSFVPQLAGQGATPIQKRPFAHGNFQDQNDISYFFHHADSQLSKGLANNIRMNTSPLGGRYLSKFVRYYVTSDIRNRPSFFIPVNSSKSQNTGRPTKRHDHSSVSRLTEHLVISTKFRHKVLSGRVAAECERSIREICGELNIKVIQIAVQPEHVHIQLQHPPKLSTSEIVEKIKSNSSRELRRKFPHLKKWCEEALWSRGFYVSSVGHGQDVVQRYIASQGSNHASSGLKGSVGRLPNAVGQPDDTLKERIP